MITYKDPTYIVNGDMSADIVGSWVNTCGFERVLFQASWSASTNTGGIFAIEGTCDPSMANVMPLTVAYNGAGPYNSSVSGTAIFGSGGAFGLCEFNYNLMQPLPEFVRLRYTRNTGGASNQLQVQVIGRQ